MENAVFISNNTCKVTAMTAGEDSVNLLDPRKVVIYRDSRGDLILKVGETSFRIAKIIRAFPITMPWRYIIFIDENGHEIGICLLYTS